MKILALDSTALVASIAVCEDSKLLAEYTVNNGNTHSENLLPMIENALNLLKLSVADLDAFAFSEGPGSFTGVRIGAATIKGLAFDRQKNCMGVSTLASLAENLSMMEGLVVPVMNARRNQVYTAIFKAQNGKVTRLTEDSAIAVPELQEMLKDKPEKIYLCGDGYELVKSQFTIPCEQTPERLRHQSAYNVAQVALRAFAEGKTQTDTELHPTYLRQSQAERERNEKNEKQ